MNEPKIEGALGRHFGTSERFGRYSPVPLLNAMDETLPPGSVVRFVTPIARPLCDFLREHGRLVKGRLWQRHWELDHVGPGGLLKTLATFVGEHSIKRLAVWFLAFDANGTFLFEMEDANNYVWLATEFDDEARVRLVEAAGGAVWPTDL